PAQLTLSVEPENATILVDGQPAGKQVTHKAGQVQIEVRAEGYSPQVLTASLVSGPQTQSVTLQKAGPRKHLVKISVEPMGTDIYEGERLIGKSPALWSDAPEGEHELTFQRDGYHEDRGRLTVSRDAEEFSFKPLRKNEPAKKAGP